MIYSTDQSHKVRTRVQLRCQAGLALVHPSSPALYTTPYTLPVHPSRPLALYAPSIRQQSQVKK